MTWARRGLVALHATALAGVWGYLTVRAFASLQPDFDFLAYHLPFALMHFGRTSYRPLPHLLFFYVGFPPLPEWIQGVLIVATDRLSAACGLGILGLAVALAGILLVRGRSFSVRWYLTALLAVPMVVTHSGSGMIDLWCGFVLLLAFVGADRLFEAPGNRRGFAVLCLGLALAMGSKFTLWPFCGLIAAAVVGVLARRLRTGELSRPGWLGRALLLGLIVAAFPLWNVVRFGNPTFPLQPPVIGARMSGVSTADLQMVSVPMYLRESPQPRRFVESALELSRLRTDEPMRWLVDQGRFRPGSPHWRMGGWSFVTVIGLTVLVPLAAWYDRTSRAACGLLAAAVALLLFLPANNELRYWLFVPLAGLFLLVKALPRLPAVPRLAAVALLVGSAAYVLSETRSWVFDGHFVHPEDLVPTPARTFWAEQAGVPQPPGWTCIVDRLPWTIFWAGPTLTEYRVQACYPPPKETPSPPAAPPPPS